MERKTILKKIIEVLQTSTQNKISVPNSMLFILGDKMDEDYLPTNSLSKATVQKDSEAFLSEASLYSYADGERLPSQTVLACLADSNDWSFERLEIFYDNKKLDKSERQSLTEEIKKLYQQYLGASPASASFSQMIKELIYLYFFNVPNGPLFIKYNQIVCENYIPWPQKIRTLKALLKRENIIFINALPGSGKKQFTKYFIANGDFNPYKVTWLNAAMADASLKDLFTRALVFLTIRDLGLEDKLSLLKKMDATALVVISVPYIHPEDLDFIDKLLVPSNIKFIILTRSKLEGSNRAVLSLDKCPVSILKKIFTSIFSDKFFTEKEFLRFCSKIDFNPLAVSLVAKTLSSFIKSKTGKDIYRFKTALLDHKTWIWKEKRLPKIHSAYKTPTSKPGVSLTSIFHRMLNDLPIPLRSKDMAELALWCRYQIPLNFLLQICPQNTIDSAIEYSLLQYYDPEKHLVFMPAFLAETLLNKETLLFSDYDSKLREIMRYFSLGQEQPMDFSSIYNALNNVLYYFQYDCIKLKTRPSKTAYALFVSWNIFLLDIITYYSSTGNNKFAQDLLENLYISINHMNQKKEKLTHGQKAIQKAAELNLLCANGSDSDSIQEDLDKLIGQLQSITFAKDSSPLDMMILSGQISTICYNTLERQIFSLYTHAKNLIDIGTPLSPYDTYVINFLEHVKTFSYNEFSTNCYYTTMHYHYILALYNYDHPSKYIAQGNTYYQYTMEDMTLSWDIKFRASLHRFFHILMQSYAKYMYHSVLPTLNDYENFAQDYTHLYQDYEGRIHSNINNQLFFTITNLYLPILLIPIPYTTCTLELLSVLDHALDIIGIFIAKQSFAQETEKQEALNLLKQSQEALRLLRLNTPC